MGGNYYLGSDDCYACKYNNALTVTMYLITEKKTEDILTENDQRPRLNSELGNLIGPGLKLSDNYENVVDSLADEGIKEVSTENIILDNVDSLAGDGFKEVSNDNTVDTNNYRTCSYN